MRNPLSKWVARIFNLLPCVRLFFNQDSHRDDPRQAPAAPRRRVHDCPGGNPGEAYRAVCLVTSDSFLVIGLNVLMFFVLFFVLVGCTFIRRRVCWLAPRTVSLGDCKSCFFVKRITDAICFYFEVYPLPPHHLLDCRTMCPPSSAVNRLIRMNGFASQFPMVLSLEDEAFRGILSSDPPPRPRPTPIPAPSPSFSLQVDDIILPHRPNYGKMGKQVVVTSNHYKAEYNTKQVLYQYDVSLEGFEKTALVSNSLFSYFSFFFSFFFQPIAIPSSSSPRRRCGFLVKFASGSEALVLVVHLDVRVVLAATEGSLALGHLRAFVWERQ